MSSTLEVRRREPERPFDLVLFGATGFTGKLVADYLARHPSAGQLRWALAGRNESKLEAVRAELGKAAPGVDPPLIVVDSHDRPGLDAMAKRTHAICTTVGPYAKHGSDVVAAAVAAGTDYCDLTGEVQWIRRMIDAHHDEARHTGARIVHCAGFDSIPSDLGTLVLQEAAKERFGRYLQEIRMVVLGMRGAASGGTVASALGVIDEARSSREVRKIVTDPYALNPEGERLGPDGRDLLGVRYEPAIEGWVGPFLMAGINTRVVRRSNALMGFPYGRDFRYSETMAFGSGPAGWSRAAAFCGGLAGFTAAVSVPPLRRLIERRLPSSGEGPDAETRRRGSFTIGLYGTGADASGTPVRLSGKVVGTSDPGYGETAKMLSETALCLALTGGALESPGGITTPAAALGMRLVGRLRDAGMTFEVDG